MKQKIKVLVVDDSAMVRQTLSDILSSDPDLEVIGTASDPFIAAKRIQKEAPDVITLDVEMPRMDGITFLRKLMAQHPLPVVMCSSLMTEGADALFDALEAGAVDIIAKPRVDTRERLLEAHTRVCHAVKAAAHARLKRHPERSRPVEPKLTADVVVPPRLSVVPTPANAEKVVCIGASTGGTEALRVVLEALPAEVPGMVIVEHMPEGFTAAFARRLNTICRVTVKEAEDGDAVLPGRALIAPGNHHLLLHRDGLRYRVGVRGGPLVSRHRPSVDVLFRSAAQCAGANAVGVLMTGMGDDGAQGLLEMRCAGAVTIAQDEESCVVFGMPREAILRGAAGRIDSLAGISAHIRRLGGVASF
jgi:two-component system chemotaxis response regulator CheB